MHTLDMKEFRSSVRAHACGSGSGAVRLATDVSGCPRLHDAIRDEELWVSLCVCVRERERNSTFYLECYLLTYTLAPREQFTKA